MEYAIIRIGNKQHRVRDGETLVVDRVATAEGGTFKPDVLLGEPKVTVKVVAHERGPKIRIGKYRKRTGYKRHNGHRSAVSRVEISLGAAKAAAPKKAAPKAEPAVEAAPAAEEPVVPKGMPAGYAELTVAAISEAAPTWRRPQLEAALAYEQQHAQRKGAIAALEAALEAKEEK
jgi:large subunit ribosomal protein L21